MNGENTRTRARLWLRAAGLAGRRGGRVLAPSAGDAVEAVVAMPPTPPWREESRVVRFCALSVLTLLTTALWFAVLFQDEAVPSYVTDETAVRTVAHIRIAQAARIARSEGDVLLAEWLDELP